MNATILTLKAMWETDLFMWSVMINMNDAGQVKTMKETLPDTYNSFHGKRVFNWLAGLASLKVIGAKVEIGREYSPVLYLTPNSLRKQRPDAEIQKELNRMKLSAMVLDADEIDIVQRHGTQKTLRVWWD